MSKRQAVARVSVEVLRDFLFPDRSDIEVTGAWTSLDGNVIGVGLEGPGLPPECETRPGEPIHTVEIIAARVTTTVEVSDE